MLKNDDKRARAGKECRSWVFAYICIFHIYHLYFMYIVRLRMVGGVDLTTGMSGVFFVLLRCKHTHFGCVCDGFAERKQSRGKRLTRWKGNSVYIGKKL